MPAHEDPSRRARLALVSGLALLLWGAGAASAGPACVAAALYRGGFETGSALGDWTSTILVSGATPADWRGIQACPAHSGDQVFRFGGTDCDSDYGAGQNAAAGPPGLAVPPGSSGTRLRFWHRWGFESNHDGGLVSVKLDGGSVYFFAQPGTIVSGAAYNGTIADAPGCPPPVLAGASVFTGGQGSFVETEVDLDAVCDVASGGTGGCAGHTIHLGFIGFTNCAVEDAGWFLDDVLVTACVPPGPMDYHTLVPCRLLDTRGADGPLGGPALLPGEDRVFELAGACGLEAPVQALALNLTVTQPQGAGHFILYAAGEPAPSTSAVNFAAGQTRANNLVLRLSADGLGRLAVRNVSAGAAHLVLDVTGFFE
jgi:hypothetical protein